MTKVDELSQIHSLKPKFIFGLTTVLSNNCFFKNDKQIVYLAASAIVIHNIQDNTQKLIYLNEPEKTITTMEISNSKKILAVVEHGNDRKPTISIYDLVKSVHLQRLTIPLKMEADNFMKIQFSCDDVYLAALSEEPDYIMYYFNWRMAKVDSRIRVIKPPLLLGPVYDMAVNPENSNKIVFVGNELFRVLRKGEVVWRQYGFHRASKYKFTAVCWLTHIRILAGTADGRVFIVELGDIKAVYHIQTIINFDPIVNTHDPLNVGPLSADRDMYIGSCMLIKTGLMIVVNNYWIYYYKLTSNNTYMKSNVFQVSRDKNLEQMLNNPELHVINTMTVSPKNKIMFCVTKRRQLFWTMIEGQPMESKIEIFGDILHSGGVSGLSVCVWKPLFMTCGTSDHTVKLWDYETRFGLLTQEYDEDVLGVSMHPTGMYAVVSMASRAVFAVILQDELVERKTFDVTGCRMMKFSMSGHMIAFVVDNVHIHIYCTTTFEKRFELKGHKDKITDFVWAENDWKVFSCDCDGRMCRFDLFSGKHVLDIIFRNKILKGIAVSSDSKQIYIASHDGEIREMYNRMTIRHKDLKHGPINSILLSRSDKILLATCQYGELLSVALPIKSEIKYKEYAVHRKPILKIQLTFDNTKLITCSEDGTICIWNVENPKENITDNTSITSNSKFVEEILISTKHLANCANRIAEYNARSQLLSKRIVDGSFEYDGSQKKQDVMDYYNRLFLRLDRHREELIRMHEDNMKNIKIEMQKSLSDYEENWDLWNEMYNKQLKTLDNKCIEIETQIIRTDVKTIIKAELFIRIHKVNIQKLTDKFNKEINLKEEEMYQDYQSIENNKRQINVEIESIVEQGEREIIEIDTHFVNKLKRSLDKIIATEQEVNNYKIKLNSIHRKESDLRSYIETNKKVIGNHKTTDKQLEETILNLKKHLHQCNKIILLKDTEMDDILSEMKIMRKQILVFQYNLEERKAFVFPLKDELERMEMTIESMNELSIDSNKDVQLLIMETDKLQVNIQANSMKIKKLKETSIVQDGFIKNMRLEIYFTFKKTDNKAEIKKIITKMYKTKFHGISIGLKMNLFKERKCLEMHYKDLEHRKKSIESLTPTHRKMIKDNIILINETNKLRKRVSLNQTKYNELLCLLGWKNLKEFQ